MYFNRITVNTLRSHLQNNPVACQLLDVRDRSDFSREHIEGSFNLPLKELERNMQCVAKDRPVYLVCTSGRLADQAADVLKRYGFANVSVVAGGLLAWSTQGFPLATNHRGWLTKPEARMVAALLILFCTMVCCDGQLSFVLLPALFALALIVSAFADLFEPLRKRFRKDGRG